MKRLGAVAMVFLGLLLSPPLDFFCAQGSASADTLDDLLQEVKIPTLPARTRDALDFLVAHKGFAPMPAHEVIQALQSGKTVSCTVVGGPTQMPIAYALHGLDNLLQVEAEVKQQQWKDRHRPEYVQAQKLLLMHIAALQAQLQGQEQQALLQAQQTIDAFKQINREQKNLQNNLSETQQYLNELLAQRSALSPLYEQAKAVYEGLHRQYQALYSTEQRLIQALADLQLKRRRLLQRIQSAWKEVSEAEAMILKDPSHVKTYRERIATQRALALSLEKTLSRLDRDIQHHRIKPYYDAALNQFEQVKRRYTPLEDTITRTQKAYATLEAEAKHISQQKQENQVQQVQWVHRVPLLQDAQSQLQQLLSMMQSTQNYGDYAAHQAQHLLSIKTLNGYSQDPLYTGYFGAGLSEGILPVRHLTEAMQKPQLPTD